ncbi:MAG TPA: TOMM precursor leader peptide-binding protein, partial [Thermoanaerobaculia bacterium]|nr:TOMM precursor leader peptide-binding protein [Thermoanaerobaculia bacterium]
MIHTPRFRGHFRVHSAEDGVTLAHETGAVRLDAPLLRRIVPLVDGQTPAEEIARRLAGELSPVDVAFGLSWLEERGYVVEAETRAPRGLESIVDALGLDPGEARRRLQDFPVAVVQAGAVSVEPLERSLRALGVRVGGEGGLTVVVTDDYLREDLAARAGGPPWMLVKPVGTLLWIGPLFEPGRRGCWRCLAERLRPWRRPDAAPPQPAADSTVLTGLGLAATEALRWVLQGSSPGAEGALVTFDVRTLESARHTFSPVPECPVCGIASPSPPPGLTLFSRAKVFTPGGGDRAATPETMLRRYGHLISPVTGIVDRLTPSFGEGHDLLHIFTAGHVDPPGPGRVPGVRRLSAGRGITPTQGRAAALCESLERHSGFFRGTEKRMEASWEDLRRRDAAAVHPNDCLRISARQYAGREAWNRLDLPFHWVPEPFDERRPVDWTPAWSLTRGEVRWLPAAYCFYDYPLPADHRFCRADSNGCAAGSCLEEAILQGFFEIVERDALALWWYNRVLRPGVWLESFRQPYFTALRGELARLGREVWLLDLTADLGIPAFAALSREVPARPGDVILGAGAHLDPAVAAAKALTEINQCLLGFLAGRPRRMLSEDPGDAPYLLPDPARPPRAADDFPALSRPDLKEEVELCVERARERGLEVLVVDQTREDVGLPVARVVVPGMRLFRARFAPGRLYDVPVALGWREGVR